MKFSRISKLFGTAALAAALAVGLFAAAPATAHAAVFIHVGFAPPPIPVYDQPMIPGDGYIWTPGYWAWDGNEYYWVDGAWVMPPYAGALWTPGYWGFNDGFYDWYPGSWGLSVGYYGGINYGFGYFGTGFYGGYWRDRHFFYNTAYWHVRPGFQHIYHQPFGGHGPHPGGSSFTHNIRTAGFHGSTINGREFRGNNGFRGNEHNNVVRGFNNGNRGNFNPGNVNRGPSNFNRGGNFNSGARPAINSGARGNFNGGARFNNARPGIQSQPRNFQSMPRGNFGGNAGVHTTAPSGGGFHGAAPGGGFHGNAGGGGGFRGGNMGGGGGFHGGGGGGGGFHGGGGGGGFHGGGGGGGAHGGGRR